jgi:hypothetical protein
MRRFVLAATVLCLLALALASPLSATTTTAQTQTVSARFGISAGEAIAGLPLGASGEPLRTQIPVLWTTADRLGVSITSASVGQGFWSEDGRLASEKDLDLVVTGRRDAIEALGAALGQAWGQSTVYIWYPTQDLGRHTTATIPLPGGASQLSDETYRQVAAQMAGGAHVKHAGPDSLIFIAKTDETEPDDAFSYRMMRLVAILAESGVQTGAIEYGRADVTVQTRENYHQYVGQHAVSPAA